MASAGEMVSGMLQWFAALPERALEMLRQLFLEDLPYYVGYGLGSLVQLTRDGIDATVAFFQELPDRVREWLTHTVETMGELWTHAKERTVETVQHMMEATVTFFMELPGRVGQWLAQSVQTIVEGWIQVRDTTVEIVRNMMDEVVDFFRNLPERIWQWLQDTVERIRRFGQEALQAARDAGRDIADGIMEAVLGLPGRMAQSLRDVGSTIRNAGANLFNSARSAGSRLTQGWRDGMGERSPSYIERSMSRIVGFMDDSVDGIGNQFQRLDRMKAQPVLEPAMALGGAASAGTTSHSTSYGDTHIHLNGVNIREEADIEKLARKLDQLRRKRERGQ